MPKGSMQLGLKAAQTLYYAEEQARRIGFPLTLSVTINFSLLDVSPTDAVPLFGRLRNQRYAPWARRPPARHSTWSFDPTYSYGFENSRDAVPFNEPDGDHNVHVHWAVHVPAPRQHHFEDELHRWIDSLIGFTDWPQSALKVKLIDKPGEVSRYLIKGAKKVVANRYGVKPDRVKPQGFIIGRRTGTTINIGPSARRALDKELGVSRRH